MKRRRPLRDSHQGSLQPLTEDNPAQNSWLKESNTAVGIEFVPIWPDDDNVNSTRQSSITETRHQKASNSQSILWWGCKRVVVEIAMMLALASWTPNNIDRKLRVCDPQNVSEVSDRPFSWYAITSSGLSFGPRCLRERSTSLWSYACTSEDWTKTEEDTDFFSHFAQTAF